MRALEIVICLTRVTCNVSLVLFVLNNPNEEREREGKKGVDSFGY